MLSSSRSGGRSSRRRLASGFVALVQGAIVAAFPAAAFATGKDDITSARDEARQLAEQGIADIDHGQTAEGVTLLERAEARFHAPTHLLYLARGYDKLGKPGLAAESYERLVGETLPNYAPDAFRDAQRLGRDELAVLRPKLARIVVVLKGAKADAATIAIDGRAPMPLLDAMSVEAGRHLITVSVEQDTRTAEITLADREEKSVDIVFVESKPAASAGSGRRADEQVTTHPFVVPAIVVFGVAGGSIAAGAATGVVSMNKVSELSKRCPTKTNCNPADQKLADDARTFGNASTATFVIGGVGAVAGLVLALIPATRTVSPAHTSSFDVEPIVGVGALGVRGTF